MSTQDSATKHRVTACTPLEPLSPPLPDGTPTHRFLTTEEAARYLTFKTTIAFVRWARRRGIECVRLGPRTRRWDRRQIEQFIGAAVDEQVEQETQPHADAQK